MTKTSFDGTKLPMGVCCRQTTTCSRNCPFFRQVWQRVRPAMLTVDTALEGRNLHWDSLGEAGERPALPRNCEIERRATLVESGDQANRWSRKNLRGRGRLQEFFQCLVPAFRLPRRSSVAPGHFHFGSRSSGRAMLDDEHKSNFFYASSKPPSWRRAGAVGGVDCRSRGNRGVACDFRGAGGAAA